MAAGRPDERTVRAVKRAATAELLAIPGVTAVGVGAKMVGGRPAGMPAIKVFVRGKRPATEVPPEELIPARIRGVRTDVEPGGDLTALTGGCPDPGFHGAIDDKIALINDEQFNRPLVGGREIQAEHYGGDPGTLGCLVWEKGNHSAVYILTVQHLFGADTSKNLVPGVPKVGQPDAVDSTCCRHIVGTWVAGNGRSPGKDEALIKLLPGVEWKPEIADIGPVKGTATAVLDGTYRVMKRGFRTGVTGGVVLSADTTTSPHSNIALLVVKPNDNPSARPHEGVTFCHPGDSGAVLLNDQCQVIGLLNARDTAGNGYAYPIGLIFQRFRTDWNLDLDVAVADPLAAKVFVVPGGSTVAVPHEVVAQLAADPAMRASFLGHADRAPAGRPWFAEVPPPPGRVDQVLADLGRSPTGRLLAGLWQRHRTELVELMHHDRRSMLAWQRGGGAGFVQLLVRMLSRPEQSLPATLHGEPLMACLHKAHAELRRCASPGLRADLERVRAILPDLAGLNYQGIVDALAAAPVQELSFHG
jgi:hypothetical protein